MGDRISGIQSYIMIEDTEIPITEYTARISKNLEDITDSTYYAVENALTAPAWTVSAICVELTIRGRFRYSVVPDPIFSFLFSGFNEAVKIVVGLDSGNIMGDGYFQIHNFEMSVPYDDIVVYECGAKSHGMFRQITAEPPVEEGEA